MTVKIAEQEERAINLIVQGVKKQFAIKQVGLKYTCRDKGYRRIFRSAGSFTCFICVIYQKYFDVFQLDTTAKLLEETSKVSQVIERKSEQGIQRYMHDAESRVCVCRLQEKVTELSEFKLHAENRYVLIHYQNPNFNPIPTLTPHRLQEK